MPRAYFYGISRWVQDEELTFRKSVELEVTLASGITYSDHASESKPQPEVGDPVIWCVTFPNSDDYATMLAGCCPQLPPASSDLFTFCTRTYGGQAQVCDFDLPCGGAWMADLNDYLAYWFPALVLQFEALELGPQTTRVAILNALSQIIQSGVPTVDSEF
jgi:hypothetical protein